MKCCTYNESRRLLVEIGVTIDHNRNLVFPEGRKTVMIGMPKNIQVLSRFAEALAEVYGDSDLFWLSYWNTEPVHETALFKKVRSENGENREIIEAPGHLFDAAAEPDQSIKGRIIYLIMAFNWEGYFVSLKDGEFLYLGDEHIVFGSASDSRNAGIGEILERFKLIPIFDVKDAWG